MGVRRLARLFVSRASLLSGIEKSGSSLLFSSLVSSFLLLLLLLFLPFSRGILFPLSLPFLFLVRQKRRRRRDEYEVVPPLLFFHPSRTVKGEVSEVSEGGIRTPRTLRLRHLPSPLPSPLACKGKDGRIPIGSLE